MQRTLVAHPNVRGSLYQSEKTTKKNIQKLQAPTCLAAYPASFCGLTATLERGTKPTAPSITPPRVTKVSS